VCSPELCRRDELGEDLAGEGELAFQDVLRPGKDEPSQPGELIEAPGKVQVELRSQELMPFINTLTRAGILASGLKILFVEQVEVAIEGKGLRAPVVNASAELTLKS
jgi:hypothetical protein